MFQATIWPEFFYSINNFTAGMSALPWLGATFILWIIVAKSFCYVQNIKFKTISFFWLPLLAIWLAGFALADMTAYAKELKANQQLLVYNSLERQDYRVCEVIFGGPEKAMEACPLGVLFEKIKDNVGPEDKIYIAYPPEIFNFYFRLRLLPYYQLTNKPEEAQAILFFMPNKQLDCSGETKEKLICRNNDGKIWGTFDLVANFGDAAGLLIRQE